MNTPARIITAAQGYSELGMVEEALEELDRLPPSIQCRPDILEVRVVVEMQAKRWERSLELARQLCVAAPETAGGFIHAAFCLHELGRTSEARAILLAGPESLQEEATYHYNLACYECALGNLESARAHLERSISLDGKLREFAKRDEDLAPLRLERGR
jgi:tetratricopeptide (TPR) repeat protein